MQIATDARTVHPGQCLSPVTGGICLTVDWCKPEDDFVQASGGEGAYNAHDAQEQDGEQDSLQRGPVEAEWRSRQQAEEGQETKRDAYGEYA